MHEPLERVEVARENPVGAASIRSQYAGDAMIAFLIDSASPARSWRASSVRRNDTSEITPRGWRKPPIRFFATGWLTASLPPMPAST